VTYEHTFDTPTRSNFVFYELTSLRVKQGGFMKWIKLIVISAFAFLFVTSLVMAQDTSSAVTQLSNELVKAKTITMEEANSIKTLLKDMLQKGASRVDIKSFVTDLANKGTKGADLKESLSSAKDILSQGDNFKEASGVVSRAVALAHQQGLKGKELAAVVHQAIQQHMAAKEKFQQVKQENQKKIENLGNQLGIGIGKAQGQGQGR